MYTFRGPLELVPICILPIIIVYPEMSASARSREDKIPIVHHAFQLTGCNKACEVVGSAELAIRKFLMSAEIGNELRDSAFEPVPLLLLSAGAIL